MPTPGDGQASPLSPGSPSAAAAAVFVNSGMVDLVAELQSLRATVNLQAGIACHTTRRRCRHEVFWRTGKRKLPDQQRTTTDDGHIRPHNSETR